jgi:hypothetical protein
MRFSAPSLTTTPQRIHDSAIRNAVYIENRDRSGAGVVYVQFGANAGNAGNALRLYPGEFRIFDRTQLGADYAGGLWLWTDSNSTATMGIA